MLILFIYFILKVICIFFSNEVFYKENEMIICCFCIVDLFYIKIIIFRFELCVIEVKIVLIRVSLLVGDYDC